MKILSAVITVWVSFFGAQAQESSRVLILDKTIPLKGVEGRIDHMAADVAGQRLFIAALGNNSVEVLDLKAGKTISSISGFAEPQGIVYISQFDRLFVANGRDGTCRILDGHSFKLIASVKLGDDADNLRYDDKAKRVYVGYGDGALGVLDARSGIKVGDIGLSAHPESFRLAANGPRIFVNVPGSDNIAVVDRDRKAVTATWPLGVAKANFPMFLDEADQRMFVGCRNPAVVVVFDLADGRMVRSIPIAHDTDDLFYDGATRRLYVSCGGGAIEVIKQVDPDHYTKLDKIESPSGARTSLWIPELKIFCLAVPHRGSQPADIQVYRTALK